VIDGDRGKRHNVAAAAVRGHERSRDGRASFATVEVPAMSKQAWACSSRCDKVYSLLKGAVQFNIGGVVVALRRGEQAAVPRGTVFRYTNRRREPACMLVTHRPPFDPDAEHTFPDELRQHEVHLSGERVKLRPMTEQDWEHVLAWNADPEVLTWSDGTCAARPPEEVREGYRTVSQFGHMFIISFAGEPIGECSLHKMNLREILRRFPQLDLRQVTMTVGRKDLWGKGLGSDALKALVRFGLEQERADGIFGILDAKNIRSWRLCLRAGLRELPGERFSLAGHAVVLAVWREKGAGSA
jgi:RimJ/RimL family protein N-acetyltransferase